MADPTQPMDPDQQALMMAMMRRNQGPLAWDQSDPNTGQNAGGQRSQVGMSNMLMPLAQALMKTRGSSALPGPTTASSITDMGAPATSNLYGLSGIGSDLGMGSAGAGAATAAGGSGLLPGSIAGANMADTAAYSPSIIEASSPASGAMGAVAAPLLGVGFGLALNSAIQSDKAHASPMGQMSVLLKNGPMGQAMAQTMIATASKYGDPNNPASWDLSKWSPEDQKAFNYGHITDPQSKTGQGHVFTKDQR